MDHDGNLWVTEGAPAGEPRGEAGFKIGKGHQVYKLSPDGSILVGEVEIGEREGRRLVEWINIRE